MTKLASGCEIPSAQVPTSNLETSQGLILVDLHDDDDDDEEEEECWKGWKGWKGRPSVPVSLAPKGDCVHFPDPGLVATHYIPWEKDCGLRGAKVEGGEKTPWAIPLCQHKTEWRYNPGR